MPFTKRVKVLTVYKTGESPSGDYATHVEIVDEGGGEFVEVTRHDGSKLAIASDEWPELREAIDRMLLCCREAVL